MGDEGDEGVDERVARMEKEIGEALAGAGNLRDWKEVVLASKLVSASRTSARRQRRDSGCSC